MVKSNREEKKEIRPMFLACAKRRYTTCNLQCIVDKTQNTTSKTLSMRILLQNSRKYV